MAKINGASTLQQFRDITWPNIRNVLILIVLLRSIWQFNKFDIIWLLTRGGPFEKTQTLTVLAYENAFQSFDFGTGSAITTIMFVLLFVFAMLYFRIFEPSQEVESY